MASEQTQPQKHSYLPLILCLLVIGYLGYQLREERQRTTPDPQRPLPTFESRIEPLKDEGTDWAGGYYFHVEKNQPPIAQPAIWQPQQMPMPQAPQMLPQRWQQSAPVQPQQRERNPRSTGDQILDGIRRDNDAWNEYMRHFRQRQREQEEEQQLW